MACAMGDGLWGNPQLLVIVILMTTHIKKRHYSYSKNGTIRISLWNLSIEYWLRLGSLFTRHASWLLYHGLSHLLGGIRGPLTLSLSCFFSLLSNPFQLFCLSSLDHKGYWMYIFDYSIFQNMMPSARSVSNNSWVSEIGLDTLIFSKKIIIIITLSMVLFCYFNGNLKKLFNNF